MRSAILLFLAVSFCSAPLAAQTSSTEKYLNELIGNTRDSSDAEKQALAYSGLAYFFRMKAQHVKALAYVDTATELSIAANSQKTLAHANSVRGSILSDQGYFQEGFEYKIRAVPYFESMKDTASWATTLKSLGSIRLQQAKVYDALDHFNAAYQLLKLTEHKSATASVLISLGNISAQLDKIEDAENYYRKALRLFEESGNFRSLNKTRNVLANFLIRINKLEVANELLNVAIEQAQERQFVYDQSQIHKTLAQLRFKQGKFAESVVQFEKALELGQGRTITRMRSSILTGMALSKEQLGSYAIAEDLAEESLEAQADYLDPSTKAETYLLLYRLSKRKNKDAEALAYYEQYNSTNDSLQKISKLEQVRELTERFQNEQQKAEIAELNLIQDHQESELTKTNLENRTIWIALVGAAVAVLLLLWNSRQRQKLHRQKLLVIEQKQTASAMQAMLNGEERERARIAKDLHDGLNGTLATVKMYVNNLHEEAPGLEGNEKYELAKKILDGTTAEVRRISHDLMPIILQREGLSVALAQYCENLNNAEILEIDLLVSGLEKRLNPRFELTLYRIIQELINNILKHAQAKNVTLQLFRIDDELQVTVEDDGVGFDASSAKEGLGLESIRSRVSMLSGEYDLDSSPSKGTSVHMTFSLNKTTSEI